MKIILCNKYEQSKNITNGGFITISDLSMLLRSMNVRDLLVPSFELSVGLAGLCNTCMLWIYFCISTIHRIRRIKWLLFKPSEITILLIYNRTFLYQAKTLTHTSDSLWQLNTDSDAFRGKRSGWRELSKWKSIHSFVLPPALAAFDLCSRLNISLLWLSFTQSVCLFNKETVVKKHWYQYCYSKTT